MRKYLILAEVLLALCVSGAVIGVSYSLADTLDSVNTAITSLNTTIMKTNGFLDKARQDEDYTKSLLNANLIHLDQVLGNVARASEKQQQTTDKTLAILDDTKALIGKLSTATDTANTSVAALQPALKQLNTDLQTLNEVEGSANKLLSGDDVKATLANINAMSASLVETSKQTAAIAGSTAGTSADIKAVADIIRGRAEGLNKPRGNFFTRAYTAFKVVRDIRQALGL